MLRIGSIDVSEATLDETVVTYNEAARASCMVIVEAPAVGEDATLKNPNSNVERDKYDGIMINSSGRDVIPTAKKKVPIRSQKKQ